MIEISVAVNSSLDRIRRETLPDLTEEKRRVCYRLTEYRLFEALLL
ncbi:MAG: hypothetical protein H0U23_12240 [Blastocatellia bacterium]|nr:hypothetical protein [Blastocatellia bacterium]